MNPIHILAQTLIYVKTKKLKNAHCLAACTVTPFKIKTIKVDLLCSAYDTHNMITISRYNVLTAVMGSPDRL